jgi:hypothetical protein
MTISLYFSPPERLVQLNPRQRAFVLFATKNEHTYQEVKINLLVFSSSAFNGSES